MSLKKTDLIDELREAIDEVTLNNEALLLDADMDDVASSNFSDESLGQLLGDAARYLAPRLRAKDLRNLIIDLTPAQYNAYVQNDENLIVDGTESPKIVRILGAFSRLANGTKAVRRTFSNQRRKRVQQASDSFPVFVAQDLEFHIFANVQNPAGAKTKAVMLPVNTTYRSSNFTVVGDQVTLNDISVVSFKDFHVGSEVVIDDGLGSSELRTITAIGSSSVATLDAVPVVTTGTFSWTVPDVQFIETKLKQALIQKAVASCFRKLAQPDLAKIAMQNFQIAVAPYRLPRMRVGIDDQPSEDE